MIKIELTNDEAVQFREYQKHHDLFTIMETTGAFNVGYGKVILNIAGGVVQNVVKEEVVYHLACKTK
jgi:hypothetical protein